jgi:hypothetical protein
VGLMVAGCSSSRGHVHYNAPLEFWEWPREQPDEQPTEERPSEVEEPAWRDEDMVLRPGKDRAIVVESPVIIRPAFNDAILSWNLDVAPGAGAWFEVRAAAVGTDDWTPWLFMSEWGAVGPEGEPVTRCDTARVDVDIFRSKRQFDRLHFRVHAAGTGEVVIRRMHLTTTLRNAGPTLSDLEGRAPTTRRTLSVPFRTQRIEDASLAGRICSPTSLSMVMAFHGADRPLLDVVASVRDARHDIYGNWPRNVQAAAEAGFVGEVVRMGTWAEAEACIARGEPVVASFWCEPGQLPEAPYPKTDGHLIVITGFTRSGDVVVNDPAAATEAAGRRVYSRANMTRVWLGNGMGTAYVIRPASGARVGRVSAPITKGPSPRLPPSPP